MKISKILICLLTAICMLCSCSKEPEYFEIQPTFSPSGTNVITSTQSDAYLTQHFPWEGADAVVIENCGPSTQLKKAMQEHEGEEVWYRVAIVYPHYSRYYENYTVTSPEAEAAITLAKSELENAEKYKEENYANSSSSERWEMSRDIKNASEKYNELREVDIKLYLSNIIETEVEFAKEIGAYNTVKQEANSDMPSFTNGYYMLLTTDMINQITARNSAWLALAPAEKMGEYSDKLSDNLTYHLSQMSETDTIEVVAVSVADCYNKYAYDQNVQVNISYNKELTKPFKDGVGKSFTEFNRALEEHLADIMKRNNILEKRVIAQGTAEIGLRGDYYVATPESELEAVSAGFNAVLTKAEILRLAEDEEIKVIYLAQQE